MILQQQICVHCDHNFLRNVMMIINFSTSFFSSVEFTVYLPDLFGGDTGNDGVETHVSEPTEPIDVRKNRQLTLDNMKLHRELEKLKQSANEHDLVKKELRNVKVSIFSH